MIRQQKLVALQAIAAIRRDAALQDLAVATRRQTTIRAVLADLAAARQATMATAGPSDLAQLDHYCQWANVRRSAIESDLAQAAIAAESRRAGAALALGRTKALEEISLRLAEKARGERSRRT
ncbi:MAG: hypothetical protein K0B00_01395 [Rhodobacteraceae bacterium]|nr:hypothetical protein [Paracoccaceae bacterium]